jgi:hypothetical protein
MAAETDNLKLILPENGEYEDVWNEPLNENMEKVDSAIGDLRVEVQAARFTKADLKSFLEIGHNADGTLKATPEVARARSSRLYGYKTAADVAYTLSDRLEQSEAELFKARRGEASLEASLAKYEYGGKNKIISGSKDINGYPTFLGKTGAKAVVDGSAIPLDMLIGGFFARERTLRDIEASGPAATLFLMASLNAAGRTVLDQDSSVAPPVSASGIISSDSNNDPIFLNDTTQDFTLLPIKVGDTLRIVGTPAAGDYFIKEIGPDATNTKISIYGKFTLDGTSLSGINYLIIDSNSPALSLETTDTSSDTALCLGEVDFDGLAVTAVRPRSYGDTFISEWRAIDVVTSPTFEQEFPHGLGGDKLQISIQVSQTNDGSGYVEELSHARFNQNLSVAITSSLAPEVTGEQTLRAAVFAPASSGASYTDNVLEGATIVGLTGTVEGTLSGSITPENNVAVRWNRNTIAVKNSLASHFYRDYAGVLQTAGFIRVVLSRKG